MFRYLLLVLCLAGPVRAQTAADNVKPVSGGAPTVAAADDPLASAQALLKKGSAGEAAAAFKAIVEKDPSSGEAQAGLVRSLLRAHQVDEAEEAGQKALAAAPSSAPVHAVVGDLAFRSGKFADAEAEYRAALKLDGNSARGTFGIARMMEMVSMRKSAAANFAKAHELDPGDREIYNTWFASLPSAQQLELARKAAGNQPSEREQARLTLLSTIVQKKPCALAGEIGNAEIKMLRYGQNLTGVSTGNREGAMKIAQGYALDVKFNDQAGASLLLDTGASGFILGRKLAEKAGVIKVADAYLGGIGDKGPVQGYVGLAGKVNIGGLEFHDCLVRVSSQNDVVDDSGLIGADVFEKFLVTLDFKDWKMLLRPLPKNPAASEPDDGPQDRYIAPEMAGYTKIWQFGHHLVIPVLVSDKATGNFVLDTGSGMNSVTPKLAHQVTKLSYEGSRIRGISGSVKEVLNGDKAILQFAKVRVRSDDIPVFDFGNPDSEGTEIAGLIGIRTLTQMKMTIDYRDGLVNLEVYEFKKARD